MAAGLTCLAASFAAGESATTRDWSGKQPVRYPDPDVISLEKEFGKYRIGTATIERIATGFRWAEGPAWNGAGNYLVWNNTSKTSTGATNQDIYWEDLSLGLPQNRG